MAKVKWTTKDLRGNRVLITGKVKLSCKHTVSESAQVRANDPELGKRTVRDLLQVAITRHIEECEDFNG
jgi:hypothetical protein